ncbi:MAG TPA: hypothetical protein DCR55_02990 [Lentisphaeria bacterium]|nr:hypothetical protein [Lentisphaeria bacterium]
MAEAARFRTLIAIGLLLTVTILCFGQALGFPYTNWDDLQFITTNPAIRQDQAMALFRIDSVQGERLYIPLTYLSYWLERWLGGPDAITTHLLNLLLHLSNVLLVFALLTKLQTGTRSVVAACLGAAVFAIHPLQAEAVCWAMGRKGLLSGLFALSGLLLFVCGVRKERALLCWLAVIAFAFGCLAKPSIIVLPAVFALLAWHLKGRPRTVLLPLGAGCIVAIAIFAISRVLPTEGAPELPPLAERLRLLPALAWHWASHLLVPIRLSSFYTLTAPTWRVIAGLGAVCAVLLVLWKGGRSLRTGLGVTAILLVPAAVIVLQHRDFLTGDRYGYLAVIGLGFLISEAARSRRTQWLCGTGGLVLAILTVPAVQTWSNDRAVWQSALRYDTTNPVAWNNLGLSHRHAGNHPEALRCFEQGLAHAPDNHTLRTNQGDTLFALGREDDALAAFLRVASRHLWSFQALAGAGRVFESRGEWDKAEQAYRRALGGNRDYTPAKQGLERVLDQRRAEATKQEK